MTKLDPVQRALKSPETAPLNTWLDDGFEEADIQRRWREIDRHLTNERSRLPRVAGLMAAAAALLLVLWFGLWQRPAGPLELAEGALPALFEARDAVSAARLSDGSTLELAPGSRLEVLRNDGRSFVSVLRRGSGLFHVEPGGPRQWIVEAGLASVEVVGTHFRVTRTEESVRVEVERGVVVVRAESLPGAKRRLGAGESVEVRAPAPIRSNEPKLARAPHDSAPQHQAQEPAPAPLTSLTPPRSLAPAPNSAPARTTPSRTAGPDDVIDRHLAAADAARRRGDRRAAIAHLEAVLERASPDDPRRGMAALSLARLTLRHDPELAASALENSMPSMPSGLAEDALARRIEAEARSGNRARAAELAREYLERFPNGHRAKDVRRWLDP